MLDAANRVARYLDGVGREEFVAREMTFDAVCLNLVRIGEGAKFLSDKAKAELPPVHWPEVITMRNRIAHGYKSLEEGIIWHTATENVPDLALLIRSALDQRP